MSDPIVMSDDQRDHMLANRPAPSVTLDGIKAKVKDARFHVDGVLTIAILTMENGYTVTGQSACADPANFDEELGRKIAYDDAIKKIWPLEGYLLKQWLYEQALTDPA